MTRNLGYIGLVCAGAAVVLAGWPNGEAAAPFDPDGVQCYPMHAVHGAVPEVKSLMPDQEENRFSKERASNETFAVPAAQAAEACAFDGCDTAGYKRLKRELKPYLFRRRNITASLYHERGDDGLDLASRIFSSDREEDMLSSLAKLYHAGKLDLASYREEKEALALLLLKPAAFRPCQSQSN